MNARNDRVTVFIVRTSTNASSLQFLQLRRAASAFMGGTYQTVRGGIEPGESAVAAARRELREETRLSPIEFYRLGSVESFYTPTDDAVWHCPAFCALVDPTVEPELNFEHDAFRWIPAGDADAAFMWPSEWPLIEEIRRVILADGPAKRFLRIDVEPSLSRP